MPSKAVGVRSALGPLGRSLARVYSPQAEAACAKATDLLAHMRRRWSKKPSSRKSMTESRKGSQSLPMLDVWQNHAQAAASHSALDPWVHLADPTASAALTKASIQPAPCTTASSSLDSIPQGEHPPPSALSHNDAAFSPAHKQFLDPTDSRYPQGMASDISSSSFTLPAEMPPSALALEEAVHSQAVPFFLDVCAGAGAPLSTALQRLRVSTAQLPVPKPSPVPLNGAYPGAATQGECLSKCGRSTTSLGTSERTCKRVFCILCVDYNACKES